MAEGTLSPCGRENSPYRHPANKDSLSRHAPQHAQEWSQERIPRPEHDSRTHQVGHRKRVDDRRLSLTAAADVSTKAPRRRDQRGARLFKVG
jgi:hypothetical protein